MRLRGALAARLISETKPRLALLVFPEAHHAGHQMWHTIDADNPIYSSRELIGGRSPKPYLKDVYCAVDQAIAGLIQAVGSEATVLVFAFARYAAGTRLPGVSWSTTLRARFLSFGGPAFAIVEQACADNVRRHQATYS